MTGLNSMLNSASIPHSPSTGGGSVLPVQASGDHEVHDKEKTVGELKD